jgi:signal peptide peptidase SppA
MKKKFTAAVKKILRKKPQVALLDLKGVIGSSGIGRGQGITFDTLNEAIEKAFELSNLKAVCLNINSPGGSPVQSELIYKYIRLLAAKKKVKIYSFIEDIAASGGYFLACAGDEIYASRCSLVGSIGVISSGFGFVETIKKIGVERRVYAQGDNKSVLDPFMPEKQSDIDMLKNAQKDVHEVFKSIVIESRGDKLQHSEELFSGMFWSGQKAQELGLVDHIGHMNLVMKEKFGDKVNIVKVNKEKGKLMKLFGMQIIVNHIFHKIEEKFFYSRFGL